MSKKNFSGGLSTVLGDQPETIKSESIKTSKIGLKENETRATFILDESLYNKLKAIAHWDRRLIKDVLNEVLQDAVTRYEKKNGDIKPVPKKKLS